jgi:integrase/recombinase XerD
VSAKLQSLTSNLVSPPPGPELPGAALDRLPNGADVDPYWRLVAAFLVGYPPHSSRAYFGDLKAWYAWCVSSSVHPLAARRHHVDAWVRYLSQVDQPTTGRPASPASIARRLSCLSKFYDYGIKDAEVLDHSPVANVRRPKVSDDSSTIGLTADELDRLLSAAEAHGPRSAALVSVLVYNGLRIAEILACDVESFTHQRGHRVLGIVRKGGKASTEPLSPTVLRAIDAYIGERTTGPLFLNAAGGERLSYSIVNSWLRLARPDVLDARCRAGESRSRQRPEARSPAVGEFPQPVERAHGARPHQALARGDDHDRLASAVRAGVRVGEVAERLAAVAPEGAAGKAGPDQPEPLRLEIGAGGHGRAHLREEFGTQQASAEQGSVEAGEVVRARDDRAGRARPRSTLMSNGRRAPRRE